MVDCGLIFGQVVLVALVFVLYMIVLAYLLRARLGEKVWLNASFWFYASSALMSTLLIPIYFQDNRFCQQVCYSVIPVHCFMRVAFIFCKLELNEIFDSAQGRVVRGIHLLWDVPSYKYFQKVVVGALHIYILINAIRSVLRFWSSCFECGDPGSCVAETDPILALGHTPDWIINFCEVVLFYKLVVETINIRREHRHQVPEYWLESDVMPKIWWYTFSSGVTLVSNFMFNSIVPVIFAVNLFHQGDVLGVDNFCSWVILLNLGIVNLSVNVGMISLCFPFRSINPLRVLHYLFTPSLIGLEDTVFTESPWDTVEEPIPASAIEFHIHQTAKENEFKMRRLNYLEESSSMMYKQPDSRTMYQEACPVAVEIQRHDTGQSQGALAIQRHQVPAASQCYGSIPAMAVRSKCVSPRKLKPLETPEQFHELVKQLPGKFPRSLWAVISSFLFHPIFDIEERLIHLMKNSSGRELRLKKIKQLMAERSKYLQNCADISDFGSSIGTLSTPCQSITVTEMNNKLKNKKYLQHCPDRSNFGSSIGISSTPCQSITVTVPSEISFELKFCGHHQIVIYNPQGICVECLYENMDMRVNRNQREQRINDDSNKEGEPNFVVWISDSMSGSLCSFYQNDFDQQDLLDMGYPHQPAISTNLGLTTGEVVGADLQDKAISEDEEAVYNILGPAAEEYGMIIGTKEDNSNGRTSQGSERI